MDVVAIDMELVGKSMNEDAGTVKGIKDQLDQAQEAAQTVQALDATRQGMTNELRQTAGPIEANDMRVKRTVDAAVQGLVERINMMGSEVEKVRADSGIYGMRIGYHMANIEQDMQLKKARMDAVEVQGGSRQDWARKAPRRRMRATPSGGLVGSLTG